VTHRTAPPPASRPRRRARAGNLLASLALAAASLCVVLGLLELGVRLLVPDPRWHFEDGTGDWRLDDEIGWVHRSSLDVTSESALGPVRFRTNADGLIPGDATRAKPAGTSRIMVFGDSMVVGRWVPQEQIYTARLAELLRERGIAADVVNAGVQGYSTDQALLLMQRWAPVYRPDWVIHGATLNDLGGIALDRASGQAKPVFRLDERGRLRLTLPRLAGRIRTLGGGPRRWIQHSALYRLVQPGLFLLRARLGTRSERVLLGDFPEVYLRSRAADGLDWELCGALLARMREAAEREGARFLLVQHPEVAETWPPYIARVRERLGVREEAYDPFAIERRLGAVAAEHGIDFVPTVAAFRAVADRGPFHLLPTDPHLNPAGHALLAELLRDAIVARGPAGPTR
jgi:lysophospholipase L1-like esterase